MHLERHLRDADATIPRPTVPGHLNGLAAQRQLEQGRTADMVAQRELEYQDLEDYYDRRERMSEQRLPAAAAADRLNQSGPMPPHSTATSSATWFGDQSAKANLGSNPTRAQTAAE